MDKQQILKAVYSFRGANREFSQEMGPIVEGILDLIDEGGGSSDAVKYTQQELTEEQQSQARTNIGGASAASVIAERDRASAAELEIMDALDGRNAETVTVLPEASASTVGKIYYVGPDSDGEYARYRGIESDGSYSFLPLGSTEMDLTDYATKAELNQLDQETTHPERIIKVYDETELADYMDYYGSALGGESGYVNASTGATAANSAMTRTAYIPTDGLLGIITVTPYGSGAGLAFYSEQDVSGYISGATNPGYGDGQNLIQIPATAKYFRTTVKNSDLSDSVATLKVVRYKKENLSSFMGDVREEMNDTGHINAPTRDLLLEDQMSLFNFERGGESGTINASTGATSSSNDYRRTAFIPTDGLLGIQTYTPLNSSAGLAFYSAASADTFISGAINPGEANGKSFVSIPASAKFFRTTVRKTDIGGAACLNLVKYKEVSLSQTLPLPFVHRNTHILYGREGFVAGVNNNGVWTKGNTQIPAINNYSLESADNNARQIISKTDLYFTRMKFAAAFLVNDADSSFSIGTYAGEKSLKILNELRIKNVNGTAVFELNYSYNAGTEKVLLTKTCEFALVAGKTYELSIQRIEDEDYGGASHKSGLILSAASLDDGIVATEFFPRNLDTHEGVSNATSSNGKGQQFVSVKSGNVTVENIYVSSTEQPHATVMLLGDSIVDGNTMVENGGQQYKYGCLLQKDIPGMVLSGLPGDGLSATSFPWQSKQIEIFAPTYCIVALGGNNSEVETFKKALDDIIQYIVRGGSIPVLVTITPYANGTRNTFMLAANEYVKSLGYRYVDINKAVTDSGTAWKSGYVLPDGTHPSVTGHEAIYEAFKREIPEIFNV